MLKPCLADLHVHTVVSPCAEVEMIPPLIVRQALRIGLQLLAVTDHNTCRNTGAVCTAAEGTGLIVLPGMELQTREEVHLLCLFETLEQADAWQVEVYRRLPDLRNPEDHLGAQFVVDASGEYLATEERLLLTSVDLGLEEAIRKVQEMGGLAIPAHVDRPAFSLLANLGMVPLGLPADGMELSRHSDPARAIALHPELGGYSLVSGGDAHQLDEIGSRTRFKIQAPGFSEVRLALARQGGRRVTVD
jgi:3',5'-nucleoside bisphosphate phosphatase